MPRHVLLLLLRLESVAAHDEVSRDKEGSAFGPARVFNNFNLVNLDIDFFTSFGFFVAEVLNDDLVFLVDVDDVDEATVIGSVKLLATRVPEKARVHSFVRVDEFNLHGPLGGLEPLEGLVVRNGKNQVFLGHQQHLDD